MNRKIAILTTGGTISQRSGADGVAAMGFNPQDLLAALGISGIDLEARALFQKSSKDVTPDDWATLARAAAEQFTGGAFGVVILHGTDTLHYTAAALSFMLEGLNAPVVLTGSMIPGGDVASDSLANLRDAIRVAAFADLAEVCIAFSADAQRSRGVIIRGNRARKIHSYAIDAFASINAPPIGYVQGERILRTELQVRGRRESKPRLNLDAERNVVSIKFTPVLTPAILSRQLQGMAAAVLEGTGIGHLRTDLYPVIEAFKAPVVVTSQAIYGGEKLGMYDADRALLAIPNVVPGADMTSETALVKLMLALNRGDVGSVMRTNLAGEITGPLADE